MPSSPNKPSPMPHETIDVSSVGFDLDNPRSVPNLLPTAWREAIIALDPKWYKLTERHLRECCKPDRVDNILRNQFWLEYSRAHSLKGKMEAGAITTGVTYDDYIRHVILKKPEKLAWIVRPPIKMKFTQEEALQEGIYQLREAISRYDDPDFLFTVSVKEYAGNKTKSAYKQVTKRLNVSALSELRKIVESLSVRVQGAITQRVEMSQQVVGMHQHQQIESNKGNELAVLSDVGALEKMQLQLHRLNTTLHKTEKLSASASVDTTETIDAEVEDMSAPLTPQNTLTEF